MSAVGGKIPTLKECFDRYGMGTCMFQRLLQASHQEYLCNCDMCPYLELYGGRCLFHLQHRADYAPYLSYTLRLRSI